MKEIDTMPVPAFTNATNAEEAFAVPASPAAIRYAHRKVKRTLDGLYPGCIAELDQNNDLLGPNGMDRELERRGFTLHGMAANGVFRLYGHPKGYGARIWKPFSVAGDSRSFISDEARITRSVFLQGLHQHLRHLGQQSYGSPLLALFYFLHVQHVCNLPLRTASANHRDAITPETVLALQCCKLRRTPANNKDYPTAKRNRCILRGVTISVPGKKSSKSKTSRVNDNNKYDYALNRCANYSKDIDDNEAIIQLHSDLLAVLSSGSHDLTSTSNPFKIFWPKLEAIDEELYNEVFSYHQSLKEGGGNLDATGATNDEKTYNNEIYNQIFQLCPNRRSKPVLFWAVKNTTDVYDRTDTDNIPTTFRGRPCFNIAVRTLREPFKPSRRRTGTRTTAITSHMHRPVPPDNLVFSRLRTKKNLQTEIGIWKLCKVGYSDNM